MTQKSITNFKQDFLYFSHFSLLNSFVTVPFPTLISYYYIIIFCMIISDNSISCY